MFNQQSPAAVEQALLAELQRKDQQFSNSIRSLLNNQFMSPVEALPRVLHFIDQHVQSLYSFVPQGSWLSSQGFPQLAQQLDFIIRDWSGARMTYYQTYQNVVIQQSQMQRIWMDTTTAVTKTINDATINQLRASNESHQDFLDVLQGTPVIRVKIF
jgi:hypothetical protein